MDNMPYKVWLPNEQIKSVLTDNPTGEYIAGKRSQYKTETYFHRDFVINLLRKCIYETIIQLPKPAVEIDEFIRQKFFNELFEGEVTNG